MSGLSITICYLRYLSIYLWWCSWGRWWWAAGGWGVPCSSILFQDKDEGHLNWVRDTQTLKKHLLRYVKSRNYSRIFTFFFHSNAKLCEFCSLLNKSNRYDNIYAHNHVFCLFMSFALCACYHRVIYILGVWSLRAFTQPLVSFFHMHASETTPENP